MNFNATPVENLPNMPPQQNDPGLMSQIMRDAHLDHQRPNVQAPHIQPSYQLPPPPASLGMEQYGQASTNSFIPEFDVSKILEKLKEPIIVAVIFFLFSTDGVKALLQQHIPTIFLGEDIMKQTLVKAGLAGVGFFIIRHFMNANKM